MTNLTLFWHRRDLRISDNLGLAAAREKSRKIVGVFCLDPGILDDREWLAPARISYLIGSLEVLQQRYLEIGSQLLIFRGSPLQIIPKLAETLKAETVHWNWDVEPYARQRDRAMLESLHSQGTKTHQCWDQLLHAPEQILSGSSKPYTVYTPFYRNWQSRSKTNPAPDLTDAEGLTEQELDIAQKLGTIPLPTIQDLGFSWDVNKLVTLPGELVASAKLKSFAETKIETYKENRDFPATDGTSQLSAALKFGTIGIRKVWQTSEEVLSKFTHKDQEISIKTWQQELAWREFYQHALYWFPKLAEGAFREVMQNFPYDNSPKLFQAWCEGKTGYPIVDAAIRQMLETGWMHNRCRMIVASFLTKDLFIDPRLGEKYFMQHLYDGDIAANNGGWQWSTSSGMDPKPLRIFNPASQAEKFDPSGNYIRHWLPELKSVSTKELLSGNISPLTRRSAQYPAPIVDHKVRQQEFKERYKRQKQMLSEVASEDIETVSE